MSEPVDYQAVLADLEAKRAALDAAIGALRLAVSIGAQATIGTTAASSASAVDPSSIPDDAFFGLSIGEAAKKYLSLVKRKQSVREIADALDRGGLPHTSSNFSNTVGTMLNRSSDPDMVRVGKGEWGLAGWYGNRRPKPEPPKRTKPHKRGEAKPRAKTVDGPSKAPGGPPVHQLATDALRAAGKPLHIGDLLSLIQESTGRQIKKDTLAATFSVAIRDGNTFVKVAPATFGLIGRDEPAA